LRLGALYKNLVRVRMPRSKVKVIGDKKNEKVRHYVRESSSGARSCSVLRQFYAGWKISACWLKYIFKIIGATLAYSTYNTIKHNTTQYYTIWIKAKRNHSFNMHGPYSLNNSPILDTSQFKLNVCRHGIKQHGVNYQYKSSAVAEMGDRGHNMTWAKRGGCCAPFPGAGPRLIHVGWAEVYFHTKRCLHPSSHLATLDVGQN